VPQAWPEEPAREKSRAVFPQGLYATTQLARLNAPPITDAKAKVIFHPSPLQTAQTMSDNPISRKSISLSRLIFPLLLALLVAAPCQAGLQEGLAAYDKADYSTALKELTALAEKGDASAQNKLGRMYSLGQGVPNDSRAAAEWFLKAAEQGVAQAQGMLGYMYLVGDGAPQSNGKAYEWIRKAAAQGDAMAQYNLGVMLGGNGAKEDPAGAAQWMRKAAEQGHGPAQGKLAEMLQDGKGVKKDLVLAYMLYGLSGKSGNSEALKNQNAIAEKMTPAQIKEGDDRLIKWKKSAPLPITAKTGTSK